MSDKVEEALKAARSLREDLKKEADKLDSFAQKARVVQAVGSAASVVVTTAVLFGSGGSLSSICMWASPIGNILVEVFTNTSVPQSAHSLVTKLQLDPRWEKLKLDFDNPDIPKDLTPSLVQRFWEEVEAAAKKADGAAAASKDCKTQQLKSFWKYLTNTCILATLCADVVKIQQLKAFCKSTLNLMPMCVDVVNLIQVSKDLYNKAPTESAVLVRKCIDFLDKRIAVYEKML